jgi:hypothetical protein
MDDPHLINHSQGNASDATFEGEGTIWVVRNNPAQLLRLAFDGRTVVYSPLPNWTQARSLVLGDGTAPDAEGLTRADTSQPYVFISTERSNADSAVSRLSIVQYNLASASSPLSPVREWNLTRDLAAIGAVDSSNDHNLGLESITWIPDSFLTGVHFYDAQLSREFTPNDYPGRVAAGIFLVGMEANGRVYAYVLMTDGSFQHITSFASGLRRIMGLQFDPVGQLWAECDGYCNGQVSLLQVVNGTFTPRRIFNRPSGMDNLNNEGLGIAPESLCSAGRKPAVWVDDSDTGDFSFRLGRVLCGLMLF